MAKVSDITITPLSGLLHIDALLDKGPDWNFLTSDTPNTLFYTFSIASGNEDGKTGQEAFTLSQQGAARYAFNYLQQITGIKFVETTTGTAAQLHLANIDIAGASTTGLASWESTYYQYADGTLSSYTANAYIYLDNNEWFGYNRDLSPGGVGYQTLLHELGHALGLSHPFHDAEEDHHDHLPAGTGAGQDNTANTIMSYTDVGGPYATFRPYDIAALNWLYGGDGLGGARGLNGTLDGRYFTGTTGADTLNGTAYADVFKGMGGNDIIVGGQGEDTVVLDGMRSAYGFSRNAAGDLVVASAGGTLTMSGIEMLSFSDGGVRASDVVIDITPPAAPQIAVTKNAAGYAYQRPLVSGTAEVNSLVRIYAGDKLVGEKRVDATGIWQIETSAFPNGLNQSLYATATDMAGNVSAASQTVTFHIDGTPPVKPTMNGTIAAGSNQPVFSGTGEVGTLIQLLNLTTKQVIGATTVQPDGKWQINSAPLPNGAYIVNGGSEDIAGNATATDNTLQFTINSPLYLGGTAGADRFTPGAGNNAIDGGAGIDTVVYAGSAANYTIQRGTYGVSVTDKTGANGVDGLYNVERIQFDNGLKALDVEGVAGQVYRVYQSVLGRPAEAAGQGYWMLRMEKGTPLLQVAKEFMQQPEFATLYGANPTEEQFLRLLYLNILKREPDAAGYEYWLNVITDENRAQIVVDFSEGFENKALVIGSIQNGIDYSIDPAWGLS